ncbi:30S ribosomal protein S20 [Erysipelothrix piscisicarius]|uniref:30S ribosomal protein S20 n=1 Tax=Erysipelothrix piscisicarius TaxID=2485784 RepID=UPI002F949012
MAIIASNAKRTKTNRKSEAANKSQRSSLKTALRSFNSAIEAGDKEMAERLFNQTTHCWINRLQATFITKTT